MKKILTTVLIVSAFLFACNNSNQSSETESVDTPGSTTQSTAPANPDASVQLPATENTGTMNPPPAPAPAPAPSSVPSSAPQQVTTAPGMNPPHGEPGHRCDIAVGAPLNSAPATPAAPASAPTVVANPNLNAPSMTPTTAPAPAPSTPTAATAPGMNPPHGEPGHDCAIPVGSPLKKK